MFSICSLFYLFIYLFVLFFRLKYIFHFLYCLYFNKNNKYICCYDIGIASQAISDTHPEVVEKSTIPIPSK